MQMRLESLGIRLFTNTIQTRTHILIQTAIDSLANFLKNMDFQIQDMWYPNEDTPAWFQ